MGIGLGFGWVLLGVAIGPVGDDPPKPVPKAEKEREKPLESPPFGEFLVVPLRVHVVKAEGVPELDCALTDEDVRRVVAKANGIWRQAGIRWDLEAIVREPAEAARVAAFRAASDAAKDAPGGVPLRIFRRIAPPRAPDRGGMDVYYIHKFAVNGVYLGDRLAFVQETAKLRPVEGGIDEPLPRVTAHELGHALNLPHRQDRTNLLASGTTGTTLNPDEARIAREAARKTPGVRDPAAIRSAAESAETSGDRAAARRLWSTLAELPGDGAAEAGSRRDALADPAPAAAPPR